jgi:hypothetical protein
MEKIGQFYDDLLEQRIQSTVPIAPLFSTVTGSQALFKSAMAEKIMENSVRSALVETKFRRLGIEYIGNTECRNNPKKWRFSCGRVRNKGGLRAISNL